MNSVERIQEYCSIEKEDGAQVTVNDNTSQEEWIRTGEIKVQDLSIRYAEDLPDVLKNVSFACKGASKVAVSFFSTHSQSQSDRWTHWSW